MTNLFVILQAPAGGGGGYGQLIMLGLIFFVLWFFMIRPQSKKVKDEKKFREEIKQGDRVVTIGGLHAKIVGVQDTTFLIEVESGTKIKIEKSAISMGSTGAATTATTADKK
jgi:preprotein translocase subunit YajC